MSRFGVAPTGGLLLVGVKGVTVLSMLTVVSHLKKVTPRRWNYFKTRLAFTMALFNLLVPWNGLPIDNDGFVPLSMAQFSL